MFGGGASKSNDGPVVARPPLNESATFRKMDMLGDLGTGDTGQFSVTISGLPTRSGTDSKAVIGVNRFSGSASAKVEVTEMHVFRVV